MKRIAIIGAGNAGCINALELKNNFPTQCEITIYHSPKKHPIEKVGQGTLPNITQLIQNILDVDWYNNYIDATIKTGILYEGWGKKQDKMFHPFPMAQTAVHFVPEKLSNLTLESSLFNVEEKTIYDPEQEIDSDIIFDCRGRHNRDKNNYDTLVSPINSVLLGKRLKLESDHDLIYTRAVATPNGWTFIIPNKDTISYGYLYNNNVTTKHDASEDFIKRFDVHRVDDHITFDNYAAKNMFVGDRTILQGNAYGFIEPLEATTVNFYRELCLQASNTIFYGKNPREINHDIRGKIQGIEAFLLWHYQFGSKHDTPFWEYAKNLPFSPEDSIFTNSNVNIKSIPEIWQEAEWNLLHPLRKKNNKN